MNYKTRLYAGVTAIAVIVFGGIFSVIAIEKVDNGNVGLKVGLSGKILSKNSLAPGFHFAGLGHIVEYPARMVQADYNQSKKKDRSITVATSDGKRVNVEVKVNYHVETTKVHDIYSKFGNVTGVNGRWLVAYTDTEYASGSIRKTFYFRRTYW